MLLPEIDIETKQGKTNFASSQNSSGFRPLNDNERLAIMSLAKKGKILSDDIRILKSENLLVSYENMQGGFCVCIVEYTDRVAGGDSIVWRGASRRSYKDSRNPVKGEMLAFSRAILYSRPVGGYLKCHTQDHAIQISTELSK